MMDKYRIPQHLDMPLKIIIWTVDEVILFLIPFLCCLLMLDAPLTGFIVGAACVMGLKKVKGEEGHYFIPVLMYWHLPPLVSYKATPPSHIREIMG